MKKFTLIVIVVLLFLIMVSCNESNVILNEDSDITTSVDVDQVSSETTNTEVFWTVRFYNDDVLLYECQVLDGTDAIYDGEAPKKASDERKDYLFFSWDKDTREIHESKDFYAVFNDEDRTFVVYYYDDGQLLNSEVCYYGQAAVWKNSTDKKIFGNEEYLFKGWDVDLDFITSDVTANAVYEKINNSFHVYYDLGEEATNSADNVSEFCSGTKTRVFEPTRDGYLFLGWTDKHNNKPIKNYYIKTTVKEDVYLTANWFKGTVVSSGSKKNEAGTAEFLNFNIIDEKEFVLEKVIYYADASFFSEAFAGEYTNVFDNVYKLVFFDSMPSQYIKMFGNRWEECDEKGNIFFNGIINKGKVEIIDNSNNQYKDGFYFGYDSLAYMVNSSDLELLYNSIWEACERIDKLERDIGNDEIVFFRINGEELGLETNDIIGIWKVFYMEHPEYYWLSNSINMDGSTVCLSVSDRYVSYAKRAAVNADIEGFLHNCKLITDSLSSDLDKYIAIHDYIIELIDYCYDENGNPSLAQYCHNIEGVVSQLGGVCEAYAKSYLFACRYVGLENIINIGYSLTNEYHTWNLIKVNGEYYMVDLTWDDTGGDPTYLFFGRSFSSMLETRIPDSSTYIGIDYFYDNPKMAEESMSLITMSKNGGKESFFVNIDSALDAINDASGDYRIELMPYRYERGPALLTNVCESVFINRTDLPECNNLVFSGKRAKAVEGDYCIFADVFFDNNCDVHSNLAFEDLGVKITRVDCTINLYDYSLTIQSCYFYPHVNGGQESRIIVPAADEYYTASDFQGNIIVNTICLKTCGIAIFRCEILVVNNLILNNGTSFDLGHSNLGYDSANENIAIIEINNIYCFCNKDDVLYVAEENEFESLVDDYVKQQKWEMIPEINFQHGIRAMTYSRSYRISITNIFQSNFNIFDIDVIAHLDAYPEIRIEKLQDGKFGFSYQSSYGFIITDLNGNIVGSETIYSDMCEGFVLFTAPSIGFEDFDHLRFSADNSEGEEIDVQLWTEEGFMDYLDKEKGVFTLKKVPVGHYNDS